MRRFLLSFRSVSNFRLQRETARRLLRLGHHVAFLYEGADDDTCRQIRADAAILGTNVVALDAYVSDKAISPPLRRRSPRRLQSFGADMVVRRSPAALTFRRIHGQALAAALEVLEQTRPDALIVNEDGISGNLPLITAAKHRNIKVLDVPFGFFLGSEFDADLARKQASGELQRPAPGRERLMQWLAPQWLKRGQFAGAIMYADLYILAAEAMGITLEDAWTVHGGRADVLCAESDFTARSYRSEGVRPDKIVVTGSPYGDVIFDTLSQDPSAKQAFGRAAFIDNDRKRLLVSWPPSYHDSRPGANEFATYEEMTRTVLGFLGTLPNVQVTVSLHPAAGEEARRAVLDAGLTPTDEYVIELIPKHDIFLTSFSSTIRWATAAGKPVVNYDAYRWQFRHFDSGGFFNEGSFAGLKARISELVDSEAAYRVAAEAQLRDGPRWGSIDGRSTERIVGALEALLR